MAFDTSVFTERERVFCEEYLVDLIATRAAIRAGYSKESAASIASENLRKPNIRTYIKELMDIRSKETLIDANYVLEGLHDVAERCRQAVPVMKFNPISGQMEQVKTDEGADVWEFDSTGANRAFELIGKHLGVFELHNKQKVNETTSIIIPEKVMSAIDKLLDDSI